MYGHIIPALFLRAHVKNMSNNNIDFHVLFQGLANCNIINDFDVFFRTLIKSSQLQLVFKLLDPNPFLMQQYCEEFVYG